MTRRAVAHTADTPGGSGGVPRRPLRQLWPISWSMPSALRAVRATIVIPFLFALTFKVIGDAQMTLFAVLAGTVAGFAVGAALLVGIGVSPTVLWVAFPLAVLVAAYTPGAAPFLIGQAAFTVTIVVLFNLLEPTGWRVGLLRVEDARLAARSAKWSASYSGRAVSRRASISTGWKPTPARSPGRRHAWRARAAGRAGARLWARRRPRRSWALL